MVGLGHTQVLMIATACVFMTVAQGPLCTPGEEQRPHNLTLPVEENVQQQTTWYMGTSQIVLCKADKCVANQNLSGYSASVSGQTSTLFIANVTRQSAGTYRCASAINTSCDLRVYARPTSVSCQQAVIQADNVTVVCTVTRIFPNPVCQFVWSINSTSSPPLHEQFITMDQTEYGDPVYYNASCSWKLPARNFSVGSHQFQVRVYPNLTESDNDTAYGVDSSWTSPQSVVYPSVKLECPGSNPNVEEGQPFSCTCKETENTFILATTTLSYGSTRVNSVNNVTASFIADRTKGELTCEGQLPDGTYVRINETVQVAFGPSIFSFEANNNSEHIILDRNSSLSFSCQAEGNPSPRLSLRKNGTELQMFNGSSHKFNLTLNYSNPRTECLDTGVYTCLAEAGQRNTTYKTLAVYVKCKPQFRDSENLNNSHQERVNGTVSINVTVFGYPEPTVFLSSDQYNLSSKDYNLTYIKLEPPYGNVSLTIKVTNKQFFQNYTLNINNTEGPLNYSFEIVEGDPVKSGNNVTPGPDVGAIVGGIVGAVLVILIIFVIVFLWRRKGAPCKGKKQQNGNALMDTTYGSDLSVNHHPGSGEAEVTIDNSPLYHMGEKSMKSDEVTVDNSDLYNLNWRSDEVEVDNSDLYNLNHPVPGVMIRDSQYKNYSDLTPTITTASSLPLNMRNKKPEDASNPYEDVSSGEKTKPKPPAAQKPKPVAKPKPQPKNAAPDQTYAMVVKVPKSDKPFAIKEDKDEFFFDPSLQPEIPDKNFENPYEDTNSEKIKEKKSSDRKKKNAGKPNGKASEQHISPSSSGYTNSGFSNPEEEVNVYANT